MVAFIQKAHGCIYFYNAIEAQEAQLAISDSLRWRRQCGGGSLAGERQRRQSGGGGGRQRTKRREMMRGGGVNAATNRQTRDEGRDKEGEAGKGNGNTMVLAVMDGATVTA